jgi:predicted nuclease of predicted toxin-antitoxin system
MAKARPKLDKKREHRITMEVVKDVILRMSSRWDSKAADDVILSEALKDNRVVLTHDRDFGRLAIHLKQPICGIVFLRPGHIDPLFTIATLQAIDAWDIDFTPSFILVARRRGTHVQLRKLKLTWCIPPTIPRKPDLNLRRCVGSTRWRARPRKATSSFCAARDGFFKPCRLVDDVSR